MASKEKFKQIHIIAAMVHKNKIRSHLSTLVVPPTQDKRLSPKNLLQT